MAQHNHAELSRKEVGRQRKALEDPPCRSYPPKTRPVRAKMRLLVRKSRSVELGRKEFPTWRVTGHSDARISDFNFI
jgi:hypothetical protein